MKATVKMFAALLGNLALIVAITTALQGCSREEPKEMGGSQDGDSLKVPEHVEFVHAEDVVRRYFEGPGLHLGVDNRGDLFL